MVLEDEVDTSVRFQTFSLDCRGGTGNMIYITDTELGGKVGHGISEVFVISAAPDIGEWHVRQK